MWVKEYPLPAPAPFTDPNPPADHTAEELHGFLSVDPAALVLCIQRTTRRSIVITAASDVDAAFLAMPKFSARLDLTCLDPRCGGTLWEQQHENVCVGIVERKEFDGLYESGRSFGKIDCRTGESREILKTPRAKLAWPRRRGTEAVCAYHSAGRLHVARVSLDAGDTRSSHIDVRASREIQTYLAGGVGIVNIDAQTYVPLDSELRPTGVIKAGGWFRGLHVRNANAMELWTTLGTTLIRPDTAEVLGTSRF
jgi:hypothetical protein